ncbi:MAG: hypothetical protein K2M95_07430, partial [Clostridiales bacterium]|nr:hypothetical protein [Clostridiales bacterium]
VLDEDERNSPEITYLLTKTQDDVNHALETAELKRRLAAADAKPPVRKQKTIIKKAAPKPKKKKKAAAKKRPTPRSARSGRSAMRPRPPMRHRSSPSARPYR